MTTLITHRACTLCEATCGIRVTTDGRRVLRIEGDPDDPFSHGHICPKAHALAEIQADPDRLKTPMRRTETGFVPIGWEEALDLAAERLVAIRDAAGNDAIALYRGNPTVHDAQSLLYWNVLQRAIPTRSQFSAGSLDTWPRWVQAGLMYGGFLHIPVPDLARCEYLLILGANPRRLERQPDDGARHQEAPARPCAHAEASSSSSIRAGARRRRWPTCISRSGPAAMRRSCSPCCRCYSKKGVSTSPPAATS